MQKMETRMLDTTDAILEYPFADSLPSAGELHVIHPDVLWLRMPLPFALDHINLWLLRDNTGWCAIDCGIDSPTTRNAWQQIFSQEEYRLSRVLATHCHPDHVGLAAWLCTEFDIRLWMSATEYAYARLMSAGLPGCDNASAITHFTKHGLSPEQGSLMLARKNHYPSLVPDLPSSYRRLQGDEQIQIGTHTWRVITGFGHAPEHVSLFCEELDILISGDMVLPRISTNVSVFALEPEANPLQLYLDSLDKFTTLPETTLILPSHGKPFRGLHRRLAQLQQHHALRLQEVYEACNIMPRSAAEIVPLMFKRPLDVHQLSFAFGEALAHLHQLWHAGLLLQKCGTDRIIRFAAAQKR